MTFQSQVNLQQAPAVAGDFADHNPRTSMTVGEGALVAGANGVVVGRFAWADANGVVTNGVVNIAAAAWGFVHREQQALITAYLAETSNLIRPGCEMTLMKRGAFWALFAAGATFKQGVYINIADGTAIAANAVATDTATANTTNGSASLVVTAVNGGNVLAVGQPISGTGIPAGAYIIAGPAAGGAGTYTMSANATATGTGVTVTNTKTVATDYVVAQTVAAGEIAKITTWGV